MKFHCLACVVPITVLGLMTEPSTALRSAANAASAAAAAAVAAAAAIDTRRLQTPCTTDLDCDASLNEFCQKLTSTIADFSDEEPLDVFAERAPANDDLCEGEGICTVKPDVCIDIFEPVCGCDNVTYPNFCQANAAGMSVIDPTGACGSNSGGLVPLDGTSCSTDADCDAETEFCQFIPTLALGDATTVAVCNDVSEGICTIKPDACDRMLQPVCGCNDVTYPNECEALSAGVSLADASHGCPVSCTTDNDCAGMVGEDDDLVAFCLKEDGVCESSDPAAVGTCTVQPDACIEIFAPVCGCDDFTYSNSCLALAVGVSIADPNAACANVCNDDADCQETNTYCRYQDGVQCGGIGACTVKPESCDDEYKPVCGCNGETYSNACEASGRGVSVSYPQGTCDDAKEEEEEDTGVTESSTGTTCTTSLNCGVNEYCYRPMGMCSDAAAVAVVGRAAGVEDEGICKPLPTVCNEDNAALTDPLVCGCDGVSYLNECEAALKGRVSIEKETPCANPCPADGSPCPGDSFCYHPDGTCGQQQQGSNDDDDDDDDDDGSCVLQAEFAGCATVFAPVCGCDGVTYSNKCLALENGVSIQDPNGPCDNNDYPTPSPTTPEPTTTSGVSVLLLGQVGWGIVVAMLFAWNALLI